MSSQGNLWGCLEQKNVKWKGYICKLCHLGQLCWWEWPEEKCDIAGIFNRLPTWRPQLSLWRVWLRTWIKAAKVWMTVSRNWRASGCKCWKRFLVKRGRQTKSWSKIKVQNQARVRQHGKSRNTKQETKNEIKTQGSKHWNNGSVAHMQWNTETILCVEQRGKRGLNTQPIKTKHRTGDTY